MLSRRLVKKLNQQRNKKPPKSVPAQISKETSNGTMVAAQFKGPLPHPAIMSQYGQLIENAPERIMKVFEENAAHVREMEKAALVAEASSDKRAQWMAFTVLMTVLGLIAYALYSGNVFFVGVGAVGVIVTAAAIIYGKRKKS